VSKEGITRDLEAMKRVGIGEAYIGVIGGNAGDTGPGGVPALTEAWWQLIEHAVREGGRLGVDIGLFNGPAWSQSGGPWVKPEQSMRHVVTSEMRVHGPQRFEGKLAAPAGALHDQEVATLAFPAAAGDADNITAHSPKISGGPATARLFDGDMTTSAPIPAADGTHSITLEVAQPFTARSLVFYPSREIVSKGELLVSDDGVQFRSVHAYTIDRHYLSPALGAEPLAPVSLSFPATTGRFFRLTFSNADPLKEIVLTGAARIENFAEKHLGKMFQGPQPPLDFYNWPPQAEPDNKSFCIPSAAVQNISSHLQGDKLSWDVPAGDWVIQRMAMASTGSQNSPAPAGATGLEIDKLNRIPLRAQLDAYVGKLLKRMPAASRTALKHVVIDSYEVGSQNWTDGMAAEFKTRFGYDPVTFLPTLSGRMVESAAQSDRFLWDLRRLVADRVGTEYIGGLRDLSREHGLKLWSENYGHGGFFGEFLQYGGQSEEISGEFWESGSPGKLELRDASSAGHIYGKPVIFAEAWTGGPAFTSSPWSLKKMGDWAFCEGVNQLVFHVNISQPDELRPGISAWFGTEFNRHNTWFNESASWIDYLKRCHYLLQQGNYVADVAYFIGEDVPRMGGIQRPELPSGYSYDYINAEVIEKRLSVKNGRFVLPDGMSYRLIVLPDGTSMRPELLTTLRDLVAQGGAVMGAPPVESPSLQNFPGCDQQVKSLAAELWAGCDGTHTPSAAFGKGHVFRGASLQSALMQLDTPPDLSDVAGSIPSEVLFTHRHTADADIYFLSNQSDNPLAFTPSFRVGERAPELWDPMLGHCTRQAVCDVSSGATRVPLHLLARGSMFVVFRDAATPSRVVKVTHDGKTIANAVADDKAALAAPAPNTFTVAVWAKPKTESTMSGEAKAGFGALYTPRSDIIFHAQGDSFGLGKGHAGSGLAVGTNGVGVYEHSADYFAPILEYSTPISDWVHVAVVYNQGQTSLYLNGKLAHTGLKTDYDVRPGEPNTTYNGGISGFRRLLRALPASDIVELMKSTGPGGSTGAVEDPLELTRGPNGELQALAWQAGRYTLESATGSPLDLTVPPIMPAWQVAGPWTLAFPPASGAPARTTLAALASLSEQTEPTIKYFSGTMTYSNVIDIPASALGSDRRLDLDLGDVGSLAEVCLNGRNLGTLWSKPFRLDISGAAKPGANHLQVRVTNVWHNRLVGQRLKPQAFTGPEVEKIWTSMMPDYGPNEPLFPTGLIGPVTLHQAVIINGGQVDPPAPRLHPHRGEEPARSQGWRRPGVRQIQQGRAGYALERLDAENPRRRRAACRQDARHLGDRQLRGRRTGLDGEFPRGIQNAARIRSAEISPDLHRPPGGESAGHGALFLGPAPDHRRCVRRATPAAGF